MVKRGNASSSVGAAAALGMTAKKRKLATHASSTASTKKRGNKPAAVRNEERGEDHVAATQRHLSQRFEQAARVREGSHTVLVQLRRQRRRVLAVIAPVASATKSKHALNAKLCVLMEMVAQLRIHLLQQRARLEPHALIRVWRRLDGMTARAAKIRHVERRVRFVTHRMEKIVVRASEIEERRRLESNVNADTEDSDKEDNRDPVADIESVEEEEDRRPLPVELAPHQWVPPILWTIYESIERACRRKKIPTVNRSPVVPREELRASMQQLMEQMQGINPYSHLHVLYRPPPAPAIRGDGGGDNSIKWEVKQSGSVQRIADSLSHYFSQLHRTAFWLESPLLEPKSAADCGRRFADLISLVRSLSTHFHYVILYLYSIAMGRADLNVTAGTIARQAATHSLRIDVREAYGLSPSLLVTSDSLIRQTYSYFPEVLVFLDEWRHEESFQAFGFDSNEAASEFVVDFYKTERKDQRTLMEIATYLKDIFHAWRMSKLGTARFEKMQISEIGALEQLVKGRLRLVVNLLYTQNIAAWVEWRQRSDRHTSRVFNELRIMASTKKKAVEGTPEESRKQHDEEREALISHSKLEQPKQRVESQQPLAASKSNGTKADADKSGAPSTSQRVVEQTEEAVKSHGDNNEESSKTQDNQEDEAEKETDVAAAEADTSPISDVRRQKQLRPNNCGRFRAPGVLNLQDQRIATKSAKSQKSAHKKQDPSRESAATGTAVAKGRKANPEGEGKAELKSQLCANDFSKSSNADDDAKSPASKQCEPRYHGSVLLKDIYTWTDEQIDAHEQEKENIYELQQQLLLLRDKMSLETTMQFMIKSYNACFIPKKARSSIGLVEAWSQIREFARTAVCYSEMIALHGAAEALIQRPSLRLDQDDAVRREVKELDELGDSSDTSGGSKVTIIIDGDEDDIDEERLDTKAEEKSPEELEEEVWSLQELKETIGSSRHAITEMLKSYNGDQTKEWHNHLVFFAQASQNLLEIAHDRVLPVQVETQDVST